MLPTDDPLHEFWEEPPMVDECDGWRDEADADEDDEDEE